MFLYILSGAWISTSLRLARRSGSFPWSFGCRKRWVAPKRVDFVDFVDSIDNMPTVKTKADSLKGFHGPKIKKTILGRTLAKTGGKSGLSLDTDAQGVKIDNVSINEVTNKIEKVTAEIGRQLKGEISKIDPGSGRKIFGFKVIVDRHSIRVEAPTITESGIKAAAQAKPVEFDPHKAGRILVEKMQGAEGGAWTGAELGLLFALTPANLHKRRAEHRIVWWRDAKNRFHYPKWQFNAAGAVLAGVQEVLQTFRSSDEWRVMRYFLAPRHQLDDRAPLDLLRGGKLDRVVAHAKANGEENSW